MNSLAKLRTQLLLTTFMLIAIMLLGMAGTWLLFVSVFNMSGVVSLVISVVMWSILTGVASYVLVTFALQPVTAVHRALAHISTTQATQAPPNAADMVFGKQVTEDMLLQVYKIAAGQHESRQQIIEHDKRMQAIIDLISMPIFVLNSERQIVFTNQAAHAILPKSLTESPEGYYFDQLINLDFNDNDDLNSWVLACQSDKVREHKLWQRVQVRSNNESTAYYDVFADYNRQETNGIELIVGLIDKTDQYVADNKDIDFISLAVHELRGPITVLRGYIEIFEDELGSKLEGDQEELMVRMHAAAGQLSTFVNNILNVARVENRQLNVHVEEENWKTTLDSIINELRPYVEARGRFLTVIHSEEDLPTVAVDRVSIYEVLSNLIDNAVKYSPDQDTITVQTSITKEGQVQTTVSDNGIGIPVSVIDHLFDKFYRSHRSRENVGGTGLGLFLCKAIIEAHSGTIWVHSKEGEGATFGFNLPQYEAIADTIQHNKPHIVRNSHGWIKNHGAIRR